MIKSPLDGRSGFDQIQVVESVSGCGVWYGYTSSWLLNEYQQPTLQQNFFKSIKDDGFLSSSLTRVRTRIPFRSDKTIPVDFLFTTARKPSRQLADEHCADTNPDYHICSQEGQEPEEEGFGCCYGHCSGILRDQYGAAKITGIVMYSKLNAHVELPVFVE